MRVRLANFGSAASRRTSLSDAVARFARPASWAALAAVALPLGSWSLWRWGDALLSGGPVLYGEGAVANAGLLLARGVDPYGPERAGTFVAANYPPLAFFIVALGAGAGPFVGLRLASILATLLLAGLVAWRAREAPWRATLLAATVLALFPVQVWGPAHKPDLLAVALAAGSVLAAGATWPRATLAGALGALAIFAKPTAAFPIAAVAAYLLWGERRAGARYLVALAAGTVALGAVALARFDPPGLAHHLVVRNALPYEPANAALLLVVGLLFLGVLVWFGLRAGTGRMRAYVIGALVVAILGGREGATINYLLDLAAASALALAPSFAASARALPPLALAAQLVLTLLLVPTGVISPTGAWGDPRRAVLAADLDPNAPHLAEDSGVLVANGIDPEVDDLFLWSRLTALGLLPDEVTPRARAGEFATVVAEVRLEALARAPAFERRRWPEPLVRAVLGAYRLDRAAAGHVRYVPNREVAREHVVR